MWNEGLEDPGGPRRSAIWCFVASGEEGVFDVSLRALLRYKPAWGFCSSCIVFSYALGVYCWVMNRGKRPLCSRWGVSYMVLCRLPGRFRLEGCRAAAVCAWWVVLMTCPMCSLHDDDDDDNDEWTKFG